MILKKKAKRERERKPFGEVKPLNLLIIALFGLAPFACIFALFACIFRSCTLSPSVYMQQTKKTQNQQTSKEKVKKQRKP